MSRPLLAVLAIALMLPAGAEAADPIMPLGEVQAGARCTGLSVVRGTDVASFDVEVLDVIGTDRPEAARILVRVSGPAVDATGVGQGFSGSPILCPHPDGVPRNIGAITETIGEFGSKTALATPIETILSQPVQPPAGVARAAPPVPGARPLAAPLTLSGISPQLSQMFTAAARRAGRTLVTTPARSRAAFPPRPLVPGAAVSIGLASGDLTLGAIGTVAYADGPDVWALGHPFDAAGRRSLFLQDAVIHAVVNNPLGINDAMTYKLGSAGNDVGTVTGDGIAAVTGRVGALPPSFPLRVTARDRDTGQTRTVLTRVAHEADVGLPTGASALPLVGGAAVAEAAAGVLGGVPARHSAEMCVAVTLREVRRRLRFCNTYVVLGPSPGGVIGPLAADFALAANLLDTYRFGTLHPTNVEVGLRLRRGVRQAFLLDADVPRRARRGRTIRVRLNLRRSGTGVVSTRTIRLRIPRDAPTGRRTLRLSGTSLDVGSNPGEEGSDLVVLFEEEAEEEQSDPGPTSVEEVAALFEDLGRYDGLTASFGGDSQERNVYRDANLRITGRVRVPITIRR